MASCQRSRPKWASGLTRTDSRMKATPSRNRSRAARSPAIAGAERGVDQERPEIGIRRIEFVDVGSSAQVWASSLPRSVAIAASD